MGASILSEAVVAKVSKFEFKVANEAVDEMPS
jgi:hypothetical protein